jgi:hypothetical protein
VTKLDKFPKTETKKSYFTSVDLSGALLGDPESRHVPAFSIAQTAHRLHLQ